MKKKKKVQRGCFLVHKREPEEEAKYESSIHKSRQKGGRARIARVTI